MVYNGDSDKQDICSVADDFANTSVLTYPLQEKTRSGNRYLRMFWAIIFDVYGGWQYDDSNNTNFPIVTGSLTANQSDISLPTGALTVRGVDIIPTGSTVYQKLVELTEEMIRDNGISEASLFTATGIPMYYRPIGSSVKLYPTPNATMTVRMTYDRGSVAFISTDTTKQPGFASEFHEAIALGMAYDYAVRNALPSVSLLAQELDKAKKTIEKYYLKRYQEMYPPIMRQSDETRIYI